MIRMMGLVLIVMMKGLFCKGIALGLVLLTFAVKGQRLDYDAEKWNDYFLSLEEKRVEQYAVGVYLSAAIALLHRCLWCSAKTEIPSQFSAGGGDVSRRAGGYLVSLEDKGPGIPDPKIPGDPGDDSGGKKEKRRHTPDGGLLFLFYQALKTYRSIRSKASCTLVRGRARFIRIWQGPWNWRPSCTATPTSQQDFSTSSMVFLMFFTPFRTVREEHVSALRFRYVHTLEMLFDIGAGIVDIFREHLPQLVHPLISLGLVSADQGVHGEHVLSL